MKKLFSTIFLLGFATALFAQYPLVDISTIQFIDDVDLAVDNDLSYIDGDTVRIQGVVTFDPCNYALSSSGSRMGTMLQDTAGGPWSGVHVLIDPGAIGFSSSDPLKDLNDAVLFIDNFAVGNIVECTGIVSNFAGNTQVVLLPIPSTVVGFTSGLPTPELVTVDSFQVSDGSGGQLITRITGEQYEGLYVELQNVKVANVTPSGDRYFWDVTDGAGNELSIRDMSGFVRNGTNDDECPDWIDGTPGVSNTPFTFTPPVIGSNLSFIRGRIVEYTVSGIARYGLAPDDSLEIGPVVTSPPVISGITRDPVVPASTDAVTITAIINDTDGSITGAELNYSVGLGNTSFTTVAMSSSGGDTWTGTIPATGPDSTYVNFWIRATDDQGLVTDAPDSLATGSFYIVYDDGINSIVRIQNTPNQSGASIFAGDSIPSMSVEGVITAGPQLFDLNSPLAMQDGTAPWSGIIIEPTGTDGTGDLFRGDRIRVTSGRILEQFGVTVLTDITFDLLSANNPIPTPVTTLNPDSLDAQVFDQSEAYEGMFVRFNNAFVTDRFPDSPGDFGEWRINTVDVDGTGVRVDDRSPEISSSFNEDSLTDGQNLAFIQGILWYSFGNVKLIPRNRDDIDGFNTGAYPNAIVAFDFNDLVPTVSGVIDQVNKTITAEVPFATDLTTLVPTIEITGQSVSPGSGTAQDFTNPVTYTVSAPIDGTTQDYTVTVTKLPNGLGDQPALSGLSLYPNPSEGAMLVNFDREAPGRMTLNVYDLPGRLLQTDIIQATAGANSYNLDLRSLNDGVYVLELRDSRGATSRLVEIAR